jgi:HTH-type transcriptional regulator, sugar sensing transcriptional regulator
MDFIDMIMYFNLTRQEATIYSTLLKEEELTGYEVAKVTGISRSNTYSSLSGLVDKGGAYIIERNATHYIPVPIEEFCKNKIRCMKDTMENILKIAPQKKVEIDGYITIKGDIHILNKMKNIIDNAKNRIYISAENKIIKLVSEDLNNACKRSIKVVVITDMDIDNKDFIIYNNEKAQNQIRLIADSKNVITGNIFDNENSTCLYSKNTNLIDLIKESIKNEIRIIELLLKSDS